MKPILLLAFLFLLVWQTQAQPTLLPQPLVSEKKALPFPTPKTRVGKSRMNKMKVVVYRPSISQDTIFLPVELINRSSISYEVDFIRFYVQDRKQVKRAISQDLELQPLFSSLDQTDKILPYQRRLLVFAFPKFTLPPGKRLVVEVYEQKGTRHFIIKTRRRLVSDPLPVLR